jgi:hypothetical protein
MPIFTIIFGDTLNGFGENLNDPEALREAVNNNVLKLVWIGIGAFVGSYLQMACWTATGGAGWAGKWGGTGWGSVNTPQPP